MPIQSTNLTWLRFADLVELATGQWRVSNRETVISTDRDGSVEKFVKKVIVPTGGAVFVADESVQDRHDQSHPTAVAARVAVDAVMALPALAGESARARTLLRDLVEKLEGADRDQVEAFLAEGSYAERYDNRDGR